jgi:putative peptide zinc metalloprotease protein
VRASDRGTLLSAPRLVAQPVAVVRPAVAQAAPVQLAPGRHLAVALIPRGGVTREHPAIFVIHGGKGQKPVVVVSDRAPDPQAAPTLHDTSSAPAPAASTPAAPATVFPFKLPAKPGPHDSQALATNSTDGGISYDVVYSLVTVTDGAKVDEENSAYALASCKACTTIAVSFQLVLIVGQTDTIMPINVAEALNVNCPSCVTLAIADQIVVSLRAAPSQELVARLTEELKQLDAIDALAASGGSPAEVAARVQAVQDAIEQDLQDSGLTYPTPTPTPTATPTEADTATPTDTPTPTATATATPTDTATQTSTPTATPTASPTDTPTPTPTP